MRRSTVFLSVASVLVLGAGLVVGRLSDRLRPVAPPAVEHGKGWFSDTLGLSMEQKLKMDGIWSDVRQQIDKMGDRRHSLDRDRDAAIRALLTPEQSEAYDKIFADYHNHRADLDKDREKLFHDANDRSRALLTPDQQVKWEAMSKDMRDHDHHGPPGAPGHQRNGSTTQPRDSDTKPS
jgi:Spy/CpxP family protein refolding chaperone